MSLSTLTPADGDFDRWESDGPVEPQRPRRPTKAAMRRADDEAIEHELGIFRHRTRENREA